MAFQRSKNIFIVFITIFLATGCIASMQPKTLTWNEQATQLVLTQSGCNLSETKLINNSNSNISNSYHTILAVNEKTKATHESNIITCDAVIAGGHTYCTATGGNPRYSDMGGLGCPDMVFLKESSFFSNP